MMSYTLHESPIDSEQQKTVPIIQMETSAPDLPHYEKWSASNAFDPDSEEFWDQEVVYEAFVDDLSSPELSPSSSEASSDIDRTVNPSVRALQRDDVEMGRPPSLLEAEDLPQIIEGYVASDGRLRIRPTRSSRRQMEIMTTSTTVSDAQQSNTATNAEHPYSNLRILQIHPDDWQTDRLDIAAEEHSIPITLTQAAAAEIRIYTTASIRRNVVRS